MDVKTLCLGLLSFREACGYDLKKEFESLFRHFYPAGFGSIYPALADLAARGLVECREIPQDGRPDRKVYRATAAGRAAFADALDRSNPQHRLRSEFLATMYFAELMDPERVEALLAERVDALRDAVEHIDAIEREWNGEASPGARFVAGFGAVVAKAAADYIESQRDTLLRDVTDTDSRRASPATRAGHPGTAP